MPRTQEDGITSVDSSQDISGPLSIGVEATMVLLNIFPMIVACWLKKARERTPTDELIFALSLTDILSVVIPSPLGLTAYFRHQWYGGERTCDFYQVTIVLFQLASMCLVTYMCLDRWLSLMQAMKFKHQASNNHTRTRVVVLVIYVFTLVVSCLPLFGLAPEALSSTGKLCQLWMMLEATVPWHHVFYLSFLTIGYANLLFTIVINITILVCLRRLQKQFGARSADRMSSAALQIDHRTTLDFTRMILMITVIFYMAWLPALVMITLQRAGIPVHDIAVLYAVLSTSLTGLLNPIIYAIFSRFYRQGYITIVRAVSKFLFGCPLSRVDVLNNGVAHQRLKSSGSTCNSIAALLSSKSATADGATGHSVPAGQCYSPLSPDSQRSRLNSKPSSVYDFQQEQSLVGTGDNTIDMHERTYIDDFMQKEGNIERMSKDIYGSNMSLITEDSSTCERCSVASGESKNTDNVSAKKKSNHAGKHNLMISRVVNSSNVF